jgi:dienelactone hydrolase
MSEEANTVNPMFTNPVAYQLPYAGEVRKGISYGDGARVLDIYLPDRAEGPVPLVLLVTGYPDPGFESRLGMKQMQIRAYQDWAKLFAANGMAAVIYSNVEPDLDVLTLLDFLKSQAGQLHIDAERMAIWSCSGNVPNAINVLNKDSSLRCGVLLYGFMLDAEGSSVQESSKAFGFVNPNQGMESFPENTPMLVIRAGKDEFPGLNDSIDKFEAEAIARNSPVSVIQYPEGVHAFDILDTSQRSVEMIKLCLGFLRLRLNVY